MVVWIALTVIVDSLHLQRNDMYHRVRKIFTSPHLHRMREQGLRQVLGVELVVLWLLRPVVVVVRVVPEG